MDGKEITIEFEHLRVAGLEWGPADAPPVLAIHGWLDNAASFSRLAPLLDGVRLIAVDLPGHGRSQHRPAACNHHFIDWAPQILDIADALGLKTFALMGHSMGAGISTLVPAAAPGRLNRMVLLEGVGPLAMAADEAPTLLRNALEDEQRVAAAPIKSYDDVAAAAMARRHGTDLDPTAARILVERSLSERGDGVRFTFDPRLKTRSRTRFTEEQVLAFLAVIDCPVLAVQAVSGWPFPKDLMVVRMATIPQLEHLEVEGGHHVHLTHPERVAAAVGRFLAQA